MVQIEDNHLGKQKITNNQGKMSCSVQEQIDKLSECSEATRHARL